MAVAATDTGTGAPERPTNWRGVLSWCLYDWANSPFITVIATFVVSAYFTKAMAPTEDIGTSQWGFMMGLSAFAVAVLSPVLGAIADRGGPRKPWLAACTALMVVGAALLWFATPAPGSVLFVLLVVGISMTAFELGMVFYNAMLPGLVAERIVGRVSGWAWALGYAGGLSCLVLSLFVFVQAETPPFGLSEDGAENVRIVGPIVALWILLFAWPVFAWTPERVYERRPLGRAVSEGLAQLARTVREVRQYGDVLRFLVARMLYMDGINTVFIFGGIYAAGTFGMEVAEVALFGILLNVTAGGGAFVFGWLDDRIGAKPTILVSILGIVAAGVPLLIVESKLAFYVLGCFIGLFFGPVQSASRSLMARMAPPGKETEMFGLYAFSGKVTAFFGPWIVGVVAAYAGQRWAMATVMPFIVAGGLMLWLTVSTKRVDPDAVID